MERHCPKCESDSVKQIVYGLPTPETLARAERGEIVLGGCDIFGDDPSWHCDDCAHEWGDAHIRAHEHSIRHREELLASDRCGCFHCLAIFSPNQIMEWCEQGKTALCPRCRIDSVIGSQSGFPIAERFLKQMQAYWFSSR